MKLAVVVQRYGADVNGGAELHARYVAERLARHAQVDVFTTCARDYVTWRNERPRGVEIVNGIRVVRFPVRHPRRPNAFGRQSFRVFDHTHSLADELAWLDAQGPASPKLVRHLTSVASDYDRFIFFSYRYYPAYHGIRAVPAKAMLVPTAERDPAIGLSVFGPIFRGARAIMYNSPEERAMIGAASGNRDVPGMIVGVGSDVPDRVESDRFRQKHDLKGPFAIYVGRIDENKGCRELFGFFARYAERYGQPEGTGGASAPLTLVLVGSAVLSIPDHPNIRHLGFLPDQDKFDAIAAASVLVMPSYYESLSMVALEAWALGRPVLANAQCDVLHGQCLRSNAGLYYDNYSEFAEALHQIVSDASLARALGDNGRQFFCRHYAWPVIERKYLDMLDRLQRDDASPRAEARGAHKAAPGIPPLPGRREQQEATLRPARQVMGELPVGPAVQWRRHITARHGGRRDG